MRTRVAGILIRRLREHYPVYRIPHTYMHFLINELPNSITEEEVQQLGERLCTTCTDFPSFSAIIHAWEDILNSQDKKKKSREDVKAKKDVQAKIDTVKESLHLFDRDEDEILTLEAFARLSLPGITEEEIKRNRSTISFVMEEQRRERFRRSKVRTLMKLKNGWVYEWVQLIA